MSEVSLAGLEPEQRAVVTAIDVECPLRERLAALGLRVGRRLQVVRRRGVAGPLQIRVDHTDLILRAAEAKHIRVELPSEALR